VILLRGTDDKLKQKAKDLERHVIQGSHYFEKDMERRLNSYNEFNNIANFHSNSKMNPTTRFY